MAKRRGNAEGSIYRRKSDNKWVGSVSLADGKRKVIYGRTRDEVAKKVTNLLKTIADCLPIQTDERTTVGQFLESWLEQSAKHIVRESTFSSYQQLVKKHLIPGLGAHRLTKLEPSHVQEFLNTKLAGGLSPRTVAYLRGLLRAALQQALKWGLVGRNVAGLVDPPRQRKPEVNVLTPDEIQALLTSVASNRLHALYVVAAALGLRQSEILGLQWPDVDFGTRTLQVRRSLTRQTRKLDEPKTPTSRRTLPMPEMVVEALRQHRTRQLAERLRAGELWADNNLVFASETGVPLAGTGVSHQFSRRLDEAKLPHVKFHALRHGTATYLLSRGVPTKIVAEILGHSSVMVTLDIYSHVQPEMLRDAVDEIERALTATK